MELKEADQRKVNNVMFKRIGVDVPMLSDGEDFSRDELPARGLAVSNRFGYTLFAHSRGFSVAKTADLLQLAEKLSDNAEKSKTAQETGIATVTVPNVRLLALSNDELTVGVCAGGDVMFHDFATLIHKSDTHPFEEKTVDPHDDTYAKDFCWSPSSSESYLILTSQGKLLLGHIGSGLECKVEKGVVAVSWSADGKHIAYVVENSELSITTSNFVETFQIQLPVNLSDEDNDSDLHVDAINWVRPDSIVVGYVQVNSEGEEDEYPLFVLNSKNGDFLQENSNVVGIVFYQLFPSIDSFVVPSISGPYMLAEYFKQWEIVVAASRRSIDDHIVLMGLFPEDGREVWYCLEIGNDIWIPRIELQESSEDNAILGLVIDCTSVQIELSDPRDESGDSVLPPCPVLICLTLEGKLSFFSFARLDKLSQFPGLVAPPSNVPDVKQSVPSGSLQLTKPVDISRALVPFSPTVVKVDQTKAGPLSSEITSVGGTPYLREDNDEEPQQDSASNFIKAPVAEDTISLYERFTKALSSPQTTQTTPGDQHLESLRLGPLVSLDAIKSTNTSGPTLALNFGNFTESENVADTHQGPLYDGSIRGLPITERAPSQYTQWVSQPPVVKPSVPATSSVPIPSFQVDPAVHPMASSVSWGQGLQSGSTAPATTTTSSWGKSLQGDSSATPSISSFTARAQLGGNAAPKFVSKQAGADRFNLGSQSRASQGLPPGRVPGVTDMEAAFIAELEKVGRMSKDVDELMSYIGSQEDTSENATAFTRHSLEELEQGIHLLSEECKSFRKMLYQEKQEIEDLRDEGMRVDAWRIYAQSLMEQRGDSRHQELWTHQKLHPELEMKRKRVLRADQELKLQIAELEGHLHNLEMKQWQQDNTQRRVNKQMRSPGQFVSVQNLYNTVNTQMAVAEELSNSLAQQMQTLNLRRSSPTKDSRATAAGILKSIGSPTDALTNFRSPFPYECSSYSSMPKGVTMSRKPTFSSQIPEAITQDTTRRRRDSMDAAWVNREAPTTTIKRVVRNRPTQFSPGNSSTIYKQGKPTSSDPPKKENFSQLRHMRSSQSTRMGPASSMPSFPASSFETSVPPVGRTAASFSATQWQLSRPESQQIKQGSAFPFGDPSGSAAISFSSSAPAINNSKESLFKWANNAPGATIQSKLSTDAPHSKFLSESTTRQFVIGSFDGSSSSLLANSVKPLATRTSSSGPADGTGGVSDSTLVPFTKLSPGGISDGTFGVELASTKSSSFSKVGTSLNQRTGSIVPIGSQSDSSRSGNWKMSSSASPTPPLAGPSPSLLLVGSASIPPPTGPVTTPLLAESTSFPQTTAPAWPSTTPKVETSTSVPISNQMAPGRKTGTESVKSTENLNQSKGMFKDQPVQNFPSFSKSDSLQLSMSGLETPDSPRVSQLHQKPSIEKETGVANETKVHETNQQIVLKPGSGGITARPVDLNSSSQSTMLQQTDQQGAPGPGSGGVMVRPIDLNSASPSMTTLHQTTRQIAQSVDSGVVMVKPLDSSPSSQSTSVSPFGQSSLWQPPQHAVQQPFAFPGSIGSTAAISASPVESNEEDMEEEASTAIGTFGGFGGLGGLGLGSSGMAGQSQKANPFGGLLQGNSQPLQLMPPSSGQLFRPATFSLPAAQSSPQQIGSSSFGSGFGSPGFVQNNLFSEAGKGFGSPPHQTAGGFGQPAQLGPGKQALGSALGAFGQTRQVGFGTPFGGGMGSTPPGGGFANATPGGGFASAATGGGFAGAAMGGGFGGGFAGAAPSGGFANVQAGGGFGAVAGGGFQAFGGNQGASPGFGSGVSPPQTNLFTQMRK